MDRMHRRTFLTQAALGAASVAAAGTLGGCATPTRPTAAASLKGFKISLAEWSFHRAISEQRTMTNLDFPLVARREYQIEVVEYVNQFFKDKARDKTYLRELKSRCDGEGVRSGLIMCDDEGDLGDVDAGKRRQAAENHHQWVDAAKYLGCHSIRVNAVTGGVGSFEEQQKRVVDGLRQLCEYGLRMGLNVIVENHGELSSNGKWLVGVMHQVGLPNCGTLPDFGNFYDYDRYDGVREMMPFAKGVSAKSHDFDAAGNETHTDYRRMIKIVLDAGYHGYLGIEYEGPVIPEREGVLKTLRLLERVRAELVGV
jgi:sugar phosphate isomerase/epimerase